MDKPRSIVIVIESADLRRVERFVRDGDLPFLSQLLADCPLVELHSPVQMLQIAAWRSLLTGASAGTHGQYVLWNQIRSGTYLIEPQREPRGSLQRYETFLAAQGLGVYVADIPADVRVADYPGRQIVDWGTEYRFGTMQTTPASLADRVLREVGPYPIPAGWISGDSQAEHTELARLLDTGLRLKGELTRWMLREPGVDHVFGAFAEVHKGMHWFWKYEDAGHVDHEAAPPLLRDAIRRLYQGVDRELAAIAAQLRPTDNLVVLSEQGMQRNYRGEHLVDALLVKLGLLVRRKAAGLPGTARPRDGSRAVSVDHRAPSATRRLRSVAKALVPDGLRWRVKARLAEGGDIDWSRTQVFPLPTDRNTYLRVNLRGREPQGTVAPGAEYEALLDRLEAELRALRNAATGLPAVASILRMREVFPGERADDLPDLAVEWCADAPVDAIVSDSAGTLSLPIRELRSANHRHEGFLLARGPAFLRGPLRLSGDLLQVAPTLLRLHGIPVPAQFERPALPILAGEPDA